MLTKLQNIAEYLKDKSIMVQVHFHEHAWIHYLAYYYNQTIFELIHTHTKKANMLSPNQIYIDICITYLHTVTLTLYEVYRSS